MDRGSSLVGGVESLERSKLANAFADHGDVVFRAARALCGPSAALDVTTDVFVQFGRDEQEFDDPGRLRGLLLMSTRDRAQELNRVRGARGVGGRSVAVALSRLPAAERDAVLMALYGGCSYRETAVVLDTAESTIKSLLRSGLERLRADLLPAARRPSTS